MLSAETIRSTRAHIGESQAAFAQRFGVNQSTVHRWETEGPPTTGPGRRMIEQVIREIGTSDGPSTTNPSEAA